MNKNNVKFKIKIKNSSNNNTPLQNNQHSFFDPNSCPQKNNKLNFNFLFSKDNKNNQNQIPFQFNNNLLNDKAKLEIKKNIFQKKPEVENVNKKENNIKTEEKSIKFKPVFQNIISRKLVKINKVLPKIKKHTGMNFFEEKNFSNDKERKKSSSRKKIKILSHNKSGNNIKINIDCAKGRVDENQIIFKNTNNILVKKIGVDNNSELQSFSENNVIKLRNLPIVKKNKKLKEFFHKEEQNLIHKESMEDFILIKESFINIENHNLSLFALFDGHNGAQVAEYLKNNFCEILSKVIKECEDLNFGENLKSAIEIIDKDISKLKGVQNCGSTGTMVIIDNDMLYCANIGDSKCFYINEKEAIQITEDHNCKNKLEVEAVKKNGAKVFNGRVFGCLLLTKAFGDTDFKEFGITCEPFIKKISINKNNIKYVIIASDGIWDVVDDKQLFKIQNELKIGNAEELCNNLINYSLNGGSIDNISCIVLKFGE